MRTPKWPILLKIQCRIWRVVLILWNVWKTVENYLNSLYTQKAHTHIPEYTPHMLYTLTHIYLYYCSCTLNFLDLNLSLRNSAIHTELYFKPRNGYQYLYSYSSHPIHTKTSIPCSQALRVSMICSSWNDLFIIPSVVWRNGFWLAASNQIDKGLFWYRPAS